VLRWWRRVVSIFWEGVFLFGVCCGVSGCCCCWYGEWVNQLTRLVRASELEGEIRLMRCQWVFECFWYVLKLINWRQIRRYTAGRVEQCHGFERMWMDGSCEVGRQRAQIIKRGKLRGAFNPNPSFTPVPVPLGTRAESRWATIVETTREIYKALWSKPWVLRCEVRYKILGTAIYPVWLWQ
jgi:hypothetical protein